VGEARSVMDPALLRSGINSSQTVASHPLI
jgi:hypothetical protein